jgi:uncharacterized protein (DUF983 family)
MLLLNMFYSMIANKCSRCHQGDVFENKNPYNFSKLFNMNKNCRHCGLKFEKEPSFFYGALYVSYGISSGWFIIFFFLDKFVLHMDTLFFAISITLFIVLVAPLTLRWSRLIWLNMFVKYDQKYKNLSSEEISNLKEDQL